MLGLNGGLFFNTDSAFKRKIVIRASSGLDPQAAEVFLFYGVDIFHGAVEETGGQQFMAPLFPLL